ncbi:hypothetical protein S40293_06717 [Stachybotrys chartarum IBT 40293]|nr:hypothetical protein S40293_06717 [Stachybotrys chartarum IBT 40293]
MATPPKRALSEVDDKDDQPDAKRLRSTEPIEDDRSMTATAVSDAAEEQERLGFASTESLTPTPHFLARAGVQRSIAMVLKHDGFDTATPEAMESFTTLVETYLETLLQETTRIALAARRERPIPTDFEATMRRFNLPMSSLKPHLKHPIPQQEVTPTYAPFVPSDQDAYITLPLLSEDLSGQPDKESKDYIPSSFPDFPSRHTYRFTPQENTNLRDSKKIREDAAKSAKQGEEALRRLVRASKMRKQKEAKTLVESDTHGRERFRLWEAMMKRLMTKDGLSEHADPDQDVADHSMIVNSEAMFARKEVSRFGKRSAAMGTNGQ